MHLKQEGVRCRAVVMGAGAYWSPIADETYDNCMYGTGEFRIRSSDRQSTKHSDLYLLRSRPIYFLFRFAQCGHDVITCCTKPDGSSPSPSSHIRWNLCHFKSFFFDLLACLANNSLLLFATEPLEATKYSGHTSFEPWNHHILPRYD